VLLGISVFKRRHRLNLKRALAFIMDLTTSVSNLVAILAGIGLVVGGLSYTGVAGAFSRELLLYADGSIPLMLAAGAVAPMVAPVAPGFFSRPPRCLQRANLARIRYHCGGSHRGGPVATTPCTKEQSI
jgi:hypothetical protein